MEESLIPIPNGIVLTLPRLHRQAAAKLRARNDPDTAELAEAHEGAAELLQERKDYEDRLLRGNSDVENAEVAEVPRISD